MRQIDLGRTGIKVSELCLGTMTWGTQNTEAEGHAQMDLALERGVNFWDTAEMYPVNPVTKETAGRTEAIIGSWFAARGGREKIVLATKIAGGNQSAIRDGALPTAALFRQAVEDSLKRLQTEWIDLYQIHWPARTHYHFRNTWEFDPRGNDREKTEALMIDVLQESAKLIAEGKIRALALSNETVMACPAWPRSRTNIRCCAASSIPIGPSFR
jgi:aryl-alcohol dehydrogenase-like predicted oxidoreductase